MLTTYSIRNNATHAERLAASDDHAMSASASASSAKPIAPYVSQASASRSG